MRRLVARTCFILAVLLIAGGLPSSIAFGTSVNSGGDTNSQVEPTSTPVPFVNRDSELSHWEREVLSHAISARIREDEIETIPRSIYPNWTEEEKEQYKKLVVEMAAEDRLVERYCRLFYERYYELEPQNRFSVPAACHGFRFDFQELYN